MDLLDRLGLVGVRPDDPARRETGDDPVIEPVGEVRVHRFARREQGVVDHAAGERRFGQQGREDGSGFGGGVGAHRRCLENERMFETARV